jgi:hypothetical protein
LFLFRATGLLYRIDIILFYTLPISLTKYVKRARKYLIKYKLKKISVDIIN